MKRILILISCLALFAACESKPADQAAEGAANEGAAAEKGTEKSGAGDAAAIDVVAQPTLAQLTTAVGNTKFALNFEQLRAAKLDQILGKIPEIAEELTKFTAETGLDPLKDINGIVGFGELTDLTVMSGTVPPKSMAVAVVLNKPLTAKVFDGKDDDNNDSDMSGMRYVAVLAAMSPEEIKAFADGAKLKANEEGREIAVSNGALLVKQEKDKPETAKWMYISSGGIILGEAKDDAAILAAATGAVKELNTLAAGELRPDAAVPAVHVSGPFAGKELLVTINVADGLDIAATIPLDANMQAEADQAIVAYNAAKANPEAFLGQTGMPEPIAKASAIALKNSTLTIKDGVANATLKLDAPTFVTMGAAFLTASGSDGGPGPMDKAPTPVTK